MNSQQNLNAPQTSAATSETLGSLGLKGTPILLTLSVNNISFVAEDLAYERHYTQPLVEKALLADSCSPPTPVSTLIGFRDRTNQHGGNIAAIANTLTPDSLHMASFAHAVNNYVTYLRTIPNSFCIGPTNQNEFNQLNSAIQGATNHAQRGIRIFEANLARFSNNVTPLLNSVLQAANAINPSSKDFRPVSMAVKNYQDFVSRYNVEIWNLSQTIEQTATSLDRLVNNTTTALDRALNQIQTNVEQAAQVFTQQFRDAEAAIRYWDQEDGKVGYDRYQTIASFVDQVLIPDFNAFLQRVPRTPRVDSAIQTAKDAASYIANHLDGFPGFRILPANSDTFPYNEYGNKDRKFGGDRIIAILERACLAHFNDTGNKLYIGDMQYEHGGRAKPHKSHRDGIDADVDPIEIGNVPNHNATLALAAAKRFLSAGATLIFYADQSVVDDANAWAKQQGVSGRLSFEADHTNHFHLRIE